MIFVRVAGENRRLPATNDSLVCLFETFLSFSLSGMRDDYTVATAVHEVVTTAVVVAKHSDHQIRVDMLIDHLLQLILL